MPRKVLTNPFGMTLIEVLITATVIAIFLMFASGLLLRSKTVMRKEVYRAQLENLVNNYVELMRDNRAWKATIANNPAPGGFAYFSPYGPDGTLFWGYDPSDLTRGFDESGAPCLATEDFVTEASGNPPNPDCPTRLQFGWELVGGNQVRVTVEVLVHLAPDRGFGAINANAFVREVTRARSDNVILDLPGGVTRCNPSGAVPTELIKGFGTDGNGYAVPICRAVTAIRAE